MRKISIVLLLLLFLIPETAFSGDAKEMARFEPKDLKTAIENMQTAIELNPDSAKYNYEVEGPLMDLLSSYMRSTGRKEARGEAVRLLKSSSPNVRHAAIGIFYSDGGKANYPILMQQLHDPDKQVRLGAISTLGHTGDKTVIPALVKELKDTKYPDSMITGHLISALGQIEGEAAAAGILKAMKGADRKTIKLARNLLAKMGEKTLVPDLLKLLKDRDRNIRLAATYVLGRTEDRAAIPALKELLKEQDKEERFMAAYALGRLGEQYAAPHLLDALREDTDNSDGLGRLDYAAALGYLKDKALVPELVKLSKDSKEKVRFHAVIARGMLGDKTALQELVEALKHQDYKIRDAAARVLKEAGDNTIMQNLIAALEYNGNINKIAEVLAGFADEKALPALERAYRSRNVSNDKDARNRVSILGALGKAGGLKAFPLLNEALKDPDKNLRMAAAETLGRMGDAKAAPALLKALKDDDEHVREAAAIALTRLGDRTGLGILNKALEDGSNSEAVIEALGLLGEPGVLYRSLTQNWVTSDQVFNQIRKKLFFPESFDSLLNSPEQAMRATGYYLLALKAREKGHYGEQLKNADLALSLIEPREYPPLAIFSLWLKAHAELKLNRAREALNTIDKATELFAYISYKNRNDFREPFEEYTLFLKGELLSALMENRQALILYEEVLTTLEKKRKNFNRPFEAGDFDNLKTMALTSLGALKLRVGKENFEKAVKGGGFMEESCKVNFHINKGESPWIDYTKSYEEEQAGKHIKAVHIEQSFELAGRLSKYTLPDGPLLAIDRATRRVVVNNHYFSDLDRPDATKLAKGKSFVIGIFKGLSVAGISARQLVSFLLESQLIETYAHLESKLCLVGEEDGEESYAAHFKGSHIYYTNMRNEQPLSFTVIINKKTGLMEISAE